MKFNVLLMAVFISAALTGSAYAHCGMCGVGAKAEDAGEGHMMESKTCLCGMKVSEDSAAHAEFNGKTYHFCNLACANKFKEDPAAALEMMEPDSE